MFKNAIDWFNKKLDAIVSKMSDEGAIIATNVMTRFSTILPGELNTIMELMPKQKEEHVVMMSLADFDSWQETVYLLSSPKNAQHLMESIAQLKAGRVRTLEPTDNESQRPKQTSKPYIGSAQKG